MSVFDFCLTKYYSFTSIANARNESENFVGKNFSCRSGLLLFLLPKIVPDRLNIPFTNQTEIMDNETVSCLETRCVFEVVPPLTTRDYFLTVMIVLWVVVAVCMVPFLITSTLVYCSICTILFNY